MSPKESGNRPPLRSSKRESDITRILSERWCDRSGGIYDSILNFLIDERQTATSHYLKVQREALQLQREDIRPLDEAYHHIMLKLIRSGTPWRPQLDPKGQKIPPYHRRISQQALKAYQRLHRMRKQHNIFQYHLQYACERRSEPARIQIQAVIDAHSLHVKFMDKARRRAERQARSLQRWDRLKGGLRAKLYCKMWKRRHHAGSKSSGSSKLDLWAGGIVSAQGIS